MMAHAAVALYQMQSFRSVLTSIAVTLMHSQCCNGDTLSRKTKRVEMPCKASPL